MRDAVQAVLDGKSYEYKPLPVSKGLRVLTRLAKVVGPALGQLLGGAESLSSLVASAGEGGDVGGAIVTLCEKLDADELDALCRDLASATMVQGERGLVPLLPQWELHFQGDYTGLFLWLRWCLGVELGPLASALQRMVPASAARAASALPAT